MRAALSLFVTATLLAACGGTQPSTTETVKYDRLQATPQSTSPLVLVDENKLGQHLKNGMRLQLNGDGRAIPAGSSSSGGSAGQPEADVTFDASAKSGFSETNVHVKGVDEGDYAKYDGRHWFIATYPQYDFYETQQQPGFQIVATDPATPDADIVGSFDFDNDWGDVGTMYLVQEDDVTTHVASVRNQWGNVVPFLPGFPMALAEDAIDIARPAVAADVFFWPGPQNSKVRVQLVNVSTPSTPVQDWDIELDGSLIDSRKIGNTLYLITRYDPWLAELQYEYGDLSVRSSNETVLEGTDTEDLLPRYRIGETEAPLSVNCLVQEGLKNTYGFASLVHITAIDLAGQKVLGSTCLNSNVEVMSMSVNALYLTGTVYDEASQNHNTVVHKFSLAETGPTYEATGSVVGSLGWVSDPVFRMHEQGGDFRIVTSIWGSDGPQHKLTILKQNNTSLQTVSELPNASHPQAIGKPGEEIYAVRFTADRGYIVTFERTDPLYALDLSDSEDPKVAGELEIPGFATYMHPVGDDLLFTLGHSADENGRVTGIKADLFNVSTGTPVVVNSINLGDSNSYSEALSNLRALSLLANGDDQLRIALPLTRYNDYVWQLSGLQLLEINGISSDAPQLIDAGVVVAAESSGGNEFYGGGIDRGILHDNAVFYTHNNAVWVASWDAPEQAKGPITKDPISCTTEARASLQVTLYPDDGVSDADFCSATVTAVRGKEHYQLDSIPAPANGVCLFVGPYEVGGTLDVHVAMPGYLPQSQEGIYVPNGVCHVQTQQLDIHLKPE